MRDTSERFTKAVGRRIAELRRARGWTQQALADRLRIDVSALQRLERGAHACTLDTLWKIARALRVEPLQLLVPPSTTAPRAGRPPRQQSVQEAVLVAIVQPGQLKE